MSTHDWNHIDELFHAALDRPAAERTTFLNANCPDEDLRREVQDMVAAHEADRPLEVEERLLHEDEPGAMAGQQIGIYELVRLLGRGGMGDVYLAERSDEHYEQQVAFKLLREGLPAAGVRARFLQERQILAQLQHPNIATLLDGGVTDDGRPFLVMQYVDGEPVTDHCRRHDLPLPVRLEIFRTICDAVHAAHTNLVVHRDLKPANILVTADGEVKLLDFGIAKILGDGVLDDSLDGHTLSLDRLLTPEHAAPEQVVGGAITTATDVYALGVLLYELLTHERPIAITSSAPGEIERAICETQPAPPSVCAPDRKRVLKGELDNIVLKALRKEPERRYQSAHDLEEDIARYLDGRPVLAQRDTLAYRVRKFTARHRWGVAAAAAFLALMATAGVLIMDQSRRAVTERDRARTEQARAEGMVAVLTELLENSDPHQTTDGATLTADDFIARIDAAVEGLDDQPEVQLRLRELLTDVFRARSNYPRARELLDLALAGPVDERTEARLLHKYALLIVEMEGTEAGRPLLQASLNRHRELFGDLHPDVGIAAQDLASVLVDTDPDRAMALMERAMAVAEIFPRTGSLGTASLANRLGRYYLATGDPARARTNFEQALVLMEQSLGEEHPHVLTVTINLAASYGAAGDWTTAADLQRQVLAVRKRVFGPETRLVARTLSSLAGSLANLGRYDEALAAYGETRRIFVLTLGPDSGPISSTLRNIATVHSLQGDYPEAVAGFDEAIAIDRQNGSVHNRLTAHKRGARSLALYEAGQRDTALVEARMALADVDSQAVDADDAYRADLRVVLVTLLLAGGASAEAETWAREAVIIRTARNPEGHPALARERCLLAAALAGQGQREASRQMLSANYDQCRNWGLLHPLQREVIVSASTTVGLTTR